jgi:branched-chain amino acid transport system ATP-binding protein
MLEIVRVTKYFGGLAALKNVSLSVKEKTIFGIIGPNGSGKTTLFNCISGIYRPTSGSIYFMGRDLTKLTPDKICKLGISRTFQIPQPFYKLTVLDNVALSLAFGNVEKSRLSIEEARKEAKEYLEFVNLLKKKDFLAKDLNVQECKKLELARALACNPKIILLDEVAAGLNPYEVNEMTNLIRRIRDDFGITVLWIEHVMKAIMSTAETIAVLNYGEKISEGTPSEVARDTNVIKAYLGDEFVR